MKISRFGSISFRNKIIVTSIVCMMFPAIIMLYSTSLFSKTIINEQALDRANQSLRIVQYQLHNLIEDMILITNQIQFDDEIQRLLHEEPSPITTKNITLQLERTANVHPDIQLTLLMKDGRYFSNYSFYETNPEQFRAEPWFAQVEELEPYETLYVGVYPNYISSQEEQDPYVIMTARAITDKSGKSIAYLILSRPENVFSSFMEKLSESVYMIDEQMQIIMQKDDNLIGASLELSAIGDTIDASERGQIYIDEHKQIYITMPFLISNWTLVSIVPLEQYANRLEAIYQSGIVLQVVCVVIFLIALTYLIRKFTKPVQYLSEVAHRIETGELHIRSNVRSGDEIGRLGRAFDHMLDRVSEMIDQIKVEQELKRQAELAMLQVQINPHFLLNVLNSIRMNLLLKNNTEDAEVVGALSMWLRSILSSQQEYVTLETELAITMQYMELVSFSLRHAVEHSITVDEKLKQRIVPRFILQPIVENCYKHAFVRRGGRIEIVVSEHNEQLKLVISDDGAGIKAERLTALLDLLKQNRYQLINLNEQADKTAGIGLVNVYRRLKIIYRHEFHMEIQSVEQQGTQITLYFPILDSEGAADHEEI